MLVCHVSNLYNKFAMCSFLCVLFVLFVYEIELLCQSKYHTVLRVCKHAFPISAAEVKSELLDCISSDISSFSV